jgi:cysteine-rich repeat protein
MTATFASGCETAGVCGNGFLEPGEFCDDGNNLSDDRCPSNCLEDLSPELPVDEPDASMAESPADAGPTPTARVTINEFVFDHTSTDVSEYIELHGAPLKDYGNLTLLVIEGDGGTTAVGAIDRVIAVGSTNADGFFATSFMGNQLENDGAQTLLLVDGFTGSQGIDLDTNDDGELDLQPWTRIEDSVAVIDLNGGFTYAGAPVLPRDLPALDPGVATVGGASRVPDGADTNSAADWRRNDFGGSGLPCCTAALSPSSGEALNTPGAANTIQL